MTGYARAAFVTASLAAALAVASCSDGADAEPTPTSAGSSSSTSSGSSTSPTSSASTSTPSSTATVNVPAAAKAHTEEGAKAFAKYFYEVASRSQYEADSSELRQLADPQCSACTSLIERADAYKKRGVHTDRDSLKVDGAMIRPDGTLKTPVIDVLATDEASKVVRRSDGAVVSSDKGAKLTFRTTLNWRGQGWIVIDSLLIQ